MNRREAITTMVCAALAATVSEQVTTATGAETEAAHPSLILAAINIPFIVPPGFVGSLRQLLQAYGIPHKTKNTSNGMQLVNVNGIQSEFMWIWVDRRDNRGLVFDPNVDVFNTFQLREGMIVQITHSLREVGVHTISRFTAEMPNRRIAQ